MVTGTRRSWKLSKRLTTSDIVTLRDFCDTYANNAFYFFNPSETLPPFSSAPIGDSGRYLVRLASDWQQTTGMIRADASVELIEVASALDMGDASAVTNAAVPLSATLFAKTAHTASAGYTPFVGGGATLSSVGVLNPHPDWFEGTSSWSMRTDARAVDAIALATGSLHVLFMLSDSGNILHNSGDFTPAEELWVHDCWADVAYGDGTHVIYRPTNYSQTITAGSVGSITNPANAFDADATSYAVLSCTHYGNLYAGVFLDLAAFAPSV